MFIQPMIDEKKKNFSLSGHCLAEVVILILNKRRTDSVRTRSDLVAHFIKVSFIDKYTSLQLNSMGHIVISSSAHT